MKTVIAHEWLRLCIHDDRHGADGSVEHPAVRHAARIAHCVVVVEPESAGAAATAARRRHGHGDTLRTRHVSVLIGVLAQYRTRTKHAARSCRLLQLGQRLRLQVGVANRRRLDHGSVASRGERLTVHRPVRARATRQVVGRRLCCPGDLVGRFYQPRLQRGLLWIGDDRRHLGRRTTAAVIADRLVALPVECVG